MAPNTITLGHWYTSVVQTASILVQNNIVFGVRGLRELKWGLVGKNRLSSVLGGPVLCSPTEGKPILNMLLLSSEIFR